MLKINNTEVYSTSKNETPQIISGTFDVTNIVRNQRTQIIEVETNQKYWIPNDILIKLEEGIKDDIQDMVVLSTPTVNDEYKKINICSNYTTYIVRRGDTVRTIANKFGTAEGSIIALNGSNSFAVGQKIRVR